MPFRVNTILFNIPLPYFMKASMLFIIHTGIRPITKANTIVTTFIAVIIPINTPLGYS